jgi:hypothetical protein
MVGAEPAFEVSSPRRTAPGGHDGRGFGRNRRPSIYSVAKGPEAQRRESSSVPVYFRSPCGHGNGQIDVAVDGSHFGTPSHATRISVGGRAARMP